MIYNVRPFFDGLNPKPIAFRKGGKIYGLSNRQKRGLSSYIYCLLDDKRKEASFWKDYSSIEVITNPKELKKIYPHLSKTAKSRATDQGTFEPWVEHLFQHGYRGVGIPFPYKPDIMAETRKLWGCTWDNSEGACKKALSFFQYFYVLELNLEMGMLVLHARRYNKSLFEQAVEI